MKKNNRWPALILVPCASWIVLARVSGLPIQEVPICLLWIVAVLGTIWIGLTLAAK